MHHNPCFNLFILHNIPFDNQGSEINKNDIFLRFDILSFTKSFFLLQVKKMEKFPYISMVNFKISLVVNQCLPFRSSRSQIFFKVGVLKSYAIFAGKHLHWSIKVVFL